MENINIEDVLRDLSKVWNNLNSDTQKFLSTIIAGRKDGNNVVFNEILKNYSND